MWIGVDPGGRKNFGVALLRSDQPVKTTCVSCAAEALSLINECPAGIGIDAPMWWSAGPSGDRRADQWIRQTYSMSGGQVQASNSLRGAALVQGALFADGIRLRYPAVGITEVHPKAVLRALSITDDKLLETFGLTGEISSDHERDAIVAAIAAREGFSGRWSRDLSKDRLPNEQDPDTYWLAPMRYFWPGNK
ncbi:MAG: DUF429 domain-containing protein [Pseudomonadota bacterium]